MRVGIIDYGMSNLLSISRAIEKIGARVELLENPDKLVQMDKVILPGVGAFPKGMKSIREGGFEDAILAYAKTGKDFLGICLGMQMLLSQGQEIEQTDGLDLIEGECLDLPKTDSTGNINIVPHVGWEKIENFVDSNFTELDNSYMYFVHSFYAKPKNTGDILCTSSFGDLTFASGIQMENVTGFQFHPEKSGEKGLNLLTKFLNK